MTIFEYIWEQDKMRINKSIVMELFSELGSIRSMNENLVHENRMNNVQSLMAHDQWRRGRGGIFKAGESR